MNILFTGQQLPRLERLHKFVAVVPPLRPLKHTSKQVEFIKWADAKALVAPPPKTYRSLLNINMFDPPGQKTRVFIYSGSLVGDDPPALITACPAVMLVELYRRFYDIPESTASNVLGLDSAKEGF